MGELWFVEEVRRILIEEGANVISPIHDVGQVDGSMTAEEIANKDLEGIDNADVVLALIDQCDSGTFFELGYANNEGQPVVAYGNKIDRSEFTMLEGSGCGLYNDLSTAIFKTLWVN
ncbi:nucleoside 2-deoxyribosyltransferase [Halobacterium sp. KA-6]|nr:nucleoside 2-deoxyribosyltransferase [Halobacterium sp. KA-6]